MNGFHGKNPAGISTREPGSGRSNSTGTASRTELITRSPGCVLNGEAAEPVHARSTVRPAMWRGMGRENSF